MFGREALSIVSYSVSQSFQSKREHASVPVPRSMVIIAWRRSHEAHDKRRYPRNGNGLSIPISKTTPATWIHVAGDVETDMKEAA